MEKNTNLKVLNVGKAGDASDSLKKLMELEEQMTTSEDKEMQEIIQKEKEKSNYGEGLLVEEATVKTNPTTGLQNVVGDEDVFSDDYVMPEEEEAKIQQIIQLADEEGKKLTIFEMSNALKEAFPFLTNEDTQEMLKITQRVKNGEKFSVYNALPESMKKHIDLQSKGLNSEQKKSMAKMFITQLIEEASMFKSLNIAGKKLSAEMEKDYQEFKKTSFAGYITEQKNRFEVEWENNAKKLEEAGDLAGAEKIRKVIRAYTDSYTLQGLLSDINLNYGKLYRFKPIKIEKFFRECESFNMKYSRSEFNIKDISLCLPVLLRWLNKTREIDESANLDEEQFEAYTACDVKIFLLAFISYTMNMKPENPQDHAFMLYFISNVLLMDSATGDEDIQFINNLLTSIKAVIESLRNKREVNRSIH